MAVAPPLPCADPPDLGCMCVCPPPCPSQALTVKPLSEVWLSVPQLSRWRLHPFTVACGGGSRLTLHIKRYGAFTRVGCCEAAHSSMPDSHAGSCQQQGRPAPHCRVPRAAWSAARCTP